MAADGLHNELVLENEGKFWHATYEPSQASLSLKEISNVDELLVEDGDNTFMWLIGALGLGGVVALASHSGGGGGGGGGANASVSATKPSAPVISFDTQANKLAIQGRPGAAFEVKGRVVRYLPPARWVMMDVCRSSYLQVPAIKLSPRLRRRMAFSLILP